MIQADNAWSVSYNNKSGSIQTRQTAVPQEAAGFLEKPPAFALILHFLVCIWINEYEWNPALQERSTNVSPVLMMSRLLTDKSTLLRHN